MNWRAAFTPLHRPNYEWPARIPSAPDPRPLKRPKCRAPNPKGIPSRSPGLPSPRGYPGSTSAIVINPERVASPSRPTAATPVGLAGILIPFPRVARHELPWVNGQKNFQPQRGCDLPRQVANGRNPVGVDGENDSCSQGSSVLATLGCLPQPRWGKPARTILSGSHPMPTHDIIDNRKEKLVDHINRILSSTASARFAVGYFFLSGLESIAQRLAGVKELRLLIGNTTNRETLEPLAEGYRRLDLVAEAAEAEAYPKRTDTNLMAGETAGNIRSAIELMDQTDEAQAVVTTLVRMIEEKRLKVKVYTKGRLHAKAYIFDYGKVFDKSGKPIERHEAGLAIIGSSNLTLSGVTHNTELNVLVQGNDNHAELGKWFDELWDESQDFDEALMQEMKQSWAVASVRPYDVYMKTLYTLVRDRLEGEDDKDILWDNEITKRPADFQKVAVRQAVQIVKDYGGAFVADVVGLGKSYIGAAIVKHFERTDHARALILCPAPLVEMWERYNEV